MAHFRREAAFGASQVALTQVDARMGLMPKLLPLLAAVCLLGAACVPERGHPPEPMVDTKGGQAAKVAAPLPGRVYADSACAGCHAVAAGQASSPNPRAPTFEAIANTPGMTLMALNAALHTSHATMPNLIVDPDHIQDLSAYLYTLKK